MLKLKSIELVAKCISWQAAQKTADTLLAHRLISSAEFIRITSSQGPKKPQSEVHNVGLVMQTTLEHIDNLKKVLKQLSNDRSIILESTADNMNYNLQQNKSRVRSRA